MKISRGGRVAGDPCYIGRKDDLDRWVKAMWLNHYAAEYHYDQARIEGMSDGLRQHHADRATATMHKMSRLMRLAKFRDVGMRAEFFRRCDGVVRMTDDDRFVMGDGPVGVLASFGEDWV